MVKKNAVKLHYIHQQLFVLHALIDLLLALDYGASTTQVPVNELF